MDPTKALMDQLEVLRDHVYEVMARVNSGEDFNSECEMLEMLKRDVQDLANIADEEE